MRWGVFVDFLVVARRGWKEKGWREGGGWKEKEGRWCAGGVGGGGGKGAMLSRGRRMCRGRLRRNEEGLVWLVVIQQAVCGDVGHDCFYELLLFLLFFGWR